MARTADSNEIAVFRKLLSGLPNASKTKYLTEYRTILTAIEAEKSEQKTAQMLLNISDEQWAKLAEKRKEIKNAPKKTAKVTAKKPENKTAEKK